MRDQAETAAEAGSRAAAEEMTKLDRLKMIWEAELIALSDCVAMEMRLGSLARGWPVSKEGMERKRKFGERRGGTITGALLQVNVLDFSVTLQGDEGRGSIPRQLSYYPERQVLSRWLRRGVVQW